MCFGCVLQAFSQIFGKKYGRAAENAAAPKKAGAVQTDGSGYMKNQPTCPGGGTYTIGSVSTDPSCSLGSPHSLADL